MSARHVRRRWAHGFALLDAIECRDRRGRCAVVGCSRFSTWAFCGLHGTGWINSPEFDRALELVTEAPKAKATEARARAALADYAHRQAAQERAVQIAARIRKLSPS